MPKISFCNSKLFPLSVKFIEITDFVELLSLTFFWRYYHYRNIVTADLQTALEIHVLGYILT